VCCSVVQCFVLCCSVVLLCVAVWCSVIQCTIMCCSVEKCVASRYSVCCSVCCNVSQSRLDEETPLVSCVLVLWCVVVCVAVCLAVCLPVCVAECVAVCVAACVAVSPRSLVGRVPYIEKTEYSEKSPTWLKKGQYV